MCEACGCPTETTSQKQPTAEREEAGHWHVHADGTAHRHPTPHTKPEQAAEKGHHHHHHHGDDAGN